MNSYHYLEDILTLTPTRWKLKERYACWPRCPNPLPVDPTLSWAFPDTEGGLIMNSPATPEDRVANTPLSGTEHIPNPRYQGLLKEKEDVYIKKDLEGYKNHTSITGIGDITATILLNTIGDVNDFKDDRKLAAYLGIVPRVYVFNETSQYGRITKMGNKIARTVLVQSTLIAIKYNGYLKHFYLRLKAKKGSGKAIIATSRKFLSIIYRTLKNDWIFEDFNRFKLAASH